jgi:hypothetical protein
MGSCGARDVQCGGAVRAWGSQGQQHARSSPPHPIAHSTALTSTRITCKQSRAHACADGAPPRVRAFSCCLGASPHTARKSQKNIGRSSEPLRQRARARCALSSRLSKLAARPSAYLGRREQNCACSTRSHSQPGPTPPARISCWRRRGLLHMWPALRSRRWRAAMLFCIKINSFAAEHACRRVV